MDTAVLNIEPTDEALMQAYRAGSTAAFDALYTRHRARLYRFLGRQLRDKEILDDLYQDVWMRVINARDRYVETARFTTWLYTIAHHRLMDHFRALRSREAGRIASGSDEDDEDEASGIDDFAAPTEAQPEHHLARRQLAQRLLAALDTLPFAQREAFLLQQEAEMSLAEIARVTAVNPETAKSRLRYAVAKLRRELASES